MKNEKKSIRLCLWISTREMSASGNQSSTPYLLHPWKRKYSRTCLNLAASASIRLATSLKTKTKSITNCWQTWTTLRRLLSIQWQVQDQPQLSFLHYKKLPRLHLWLIYPETCPKESAFQMKNVKNQWMRHILAVDLQQVDLRQPSSNCQSLLRFSRA